MMTVIERGSIYTLAVKGSYTGKPRPAIVLQNPKVAFDSVVVILTTSQYVDAPFFRIPIDPSKENGFATLTYAMTEKIATVPRASLGKLIGQIDTAAMNRIEAAVREVLAL